MGSEKIYNFNKIQLIILSLKIRPPGILSTQYITKILSILFTKYILVEFIIIKTRDGQFANRLHFLNVPSNEVK